MEIKLVKQSYGQLKMEFSEEDIKEMYGENVKNVFYTEIDEDTQGGFIGIQRENNTFSVYGLRQDVEQTTYLTMLAMLFEEWQLLN